MTSNVLTTLETIDAPNPSSPFTQSSPQLVDPEIEYVSLPRRISRLPPVPTVPNCSWTTDSEAGPSVQRYFFVAVRKGHRTGVYLSWTEAEKQILNHPCPVFKTFSTRLAAEAFIAGWDGAGRHSLPSSAPRPLREHLAMTFPNAVPLTSSTNSASKPSYHTRLLSSPTPLHSIDNMVTTDFGPAAASTVRPGMPARHSASFRHSLVKVSSPLRQEVDETSKPPLRKSTSLMNFAGLLSPPTSPELGVRPPPIQASGNSRDRHVRGMSIDNGKHMNVRPFSNLPTPPHSPPSPAKKVPAKRTPSGLWADVTPSLAVPSPQPASGKGALEVDFSANSAAPKFSRSALKKNGIVMPVAAPRSHSSTSLSSLRNKSSTPSLRSSPSTTSLSSISSYSGINPKSFRRQTSQYSSQDRLSSLAETSKKELQLNEEGLLALSALSPPRPAFMRRSSNSSLSSLSSITSGTTAHSFSDSCDTISEAEENSVASKQEELIEIPVISCTKSDADADGSVESTSMKSGIQGKQKKGGLFKRLTKALKLEKKSVPGHENGRRGSL